MKVLFAIAVGALLAACDVPASNITPPHSTSGASEARATVQLQASGLTVEQENIKRRLEADNQLGSIKHLYVISAFSGDVILYSTVKGKVTSSGKRLTPYSVAALDGRDVSMEHYGIKVDVGGYARRTAEVLQDDGTYGSSVDYIYWWDSKGVYHQHYISGGQIVHVSSAPLRVGKVIINLENQAN